MQHVTTCPYCLGTFPHQGPTGCPRIYYPIGMIKSVEDIPVPWIMGGEPRHIAVVAIEYPPERPKVVDLVFEDGLRMAETKGAKYQQLLRDDRFSWDYAEKKSVAMTSEPQGAHSAACAAFGRGGENVDLDELNRCPGCNADVAFEAWYRKEFGEALAEEERAVELDSEWAGACRSAFEAGRAFEQQKKVSS
jgi:hypothetical protein